MKHYFNFNLNGNKLIGIWLLLYVIVYAPMIWVQITTQELTEASPEAVGAMFGYWALIIALIFIQYAILFYFIKWSIEVVEFRNEKFLFHGTFGEYLKVLLLNGLLTLITFGIYYPWMLAKIYRFVCKNTEYAGSRFDFNSKGGALFIILLIIIFLPITLFSLIFGAVAGIQAINGTAPETAANVIGITSIAMMFIILIIIIPYYYFYYNWIINFQFKDYNIRWTTKAGGAVMKIGLEIFLSLITLGIYAPAALVKLYDYFMERTVAVSDEEELRFGYDMEIKKDYLFLLVQNLLTLITAGIYLPWAYCKINQYLLQKSYIDFPKDEEESAVTAIDSVSY